MKVYTVRTNSQVDCVKGLNYRNKLAKQTAPLQS